MRRLLALRGLRRLRGVRWMCTSLVGCRAAASNVFLSAAGQAAVAAAEAAAQRRRTCRNALHEIGAAAECGVQYAGPIAGGTGDANAGDHASTGAFHHLQPRRDRSRTDRHRGSVLSGRRLSASGALLETGRSATLFVDWCPRSSGKITGRLLQRPFSLLAFISNARRRCGRLF